MAGEEGQRRRLLLGEERAGVAALGQVHHGSGWESSRERLHARIERVIVARCDPHRNVGQRRSMRYRVVGREGGGRSVRARVGPLRLRVAGPDRGADRGRRGDEVRILLGEQQGAVAAHRDAHHPDPPGRASQAEAPAQRDQLTDHHRHRVVTRMRVPVAVAAVDGDQRHRSERPAVHLERHGLRGGHADQGVGVVTAVAVEHDHQRQFGPGAVSRRVGDRVPDRPAPGRRVEHARGPGPGRRERKRRARHRARPVQRVEHGLAWQDAARDQLEAGGPGNRQGRRGTQPQRQYPAPGPPGPASPGAFVPAGHALAVPGLTWVIAPGPPPAGRSARPAAPPRTRSSSRRPRPRQSPRGGTDCPVAALRR